MSKHAIIRNLEESRFKTDIPDFRVGDTIAVQVKIIEGSKERVQTFTGTVIARKGTGISETFSMHRIAYGEGMERVFMLHSPRIVSIEIVREGDVRRAKLYYLRGTSGKRAKVRGRVVSRSKKSNGAKAEAVAVEEVVESAPVSATADVDGTVPPVTAEAELAGEAVAAHATATATATAEPEAEASASESAPAENASEEKD